MREKLIEDVMKHLRIQRERAKEFLDSLPEDVVKMHSKPLQKDNFFVIISQHYNGVDAQYRLSKNITYLTGKLKAMYTVDQLYDLTKIGPPLLKVFLEEGRGLSIEYINKLASLVGLTVSFQEINDFYYELGARTQPPAITDFNKGLYEHMRQYLRLPSPSEVGKEAVVRIATIGERNSSVSGEIQRVSDSYMNGSIVRGDEVLTLFFDFQPETIAWMKEIDKIQQVMTIGNMNIMAWQILESIERGYNVRDERVYTWMTMVKVPSSKSLKVTFIAEYQKYTSEISFENLRIAPLKKGVIILGGI